MQHGKDTRLHGWFLGENGEVFFFSEEVEAHGFSLKKIVTRLHNKLPVFL